MKQAAPCSHISYIIHLTFTFFNEFCGYRRRYPALIEMNVGWVFPSFAQYAIIFPAAFWQAILYQQLRVAQLPVNRTDAIAKKSTYQADEFV